MKVYMIICLPGQFSYLGKFRFTSYVPKWPEKGQILGFFRYFAKFYENLLLVLAWNVMLSWFSVSWSSPVSSKFLVHKYRPNWAQNGPKEVKFRVFWIFWNILLYFFAGCSLKWKVIMVTHLCEIPYLGRFRNLVIFVIWSSIYRPKIAQNDPKLWFYEYYEKICH